MSQVAQFLASVCVIDTETTGLDPTSAEIVELACGHYSNDEWHVTSQLFNTPTGIPPEASAKNQISNRMLAGQPYFNENHLLPILDMIGEPKYFVAHNTRYDSQVLSSSFARMKQPDLALMFATQELWICTWRIARRIYQHEFRDQIYGQNYLRYHLDLPVPDSLGVHRAGDDVMVCGVMLERLVEDAIRLGFVSSDMPIGPQMVTLTMAPIPVLSWPNGKYRGQTLQSIPTDYYLWAIENQGSLQEANPGYDFDLAESVRQELETRLAAGA